MSIGNLIFAFFLGSVALAVTFIQFPDFFDQVLNHAEVIRGKLITLFPVSNDGLQVKNLVRFLIGETQLVFMFFVILARIVVSLFMWMVSSLLGFKS